MQTGTRNAESISKPGCGVFVPANLQENTSTTCYNLREHTRKNRVT